ncbi:sodium ion-translocating decarboxylase subunit beta [Alkaliphilus hydrothermalis]|uniref:Na+-transporting methylmalonyl-CoA/oxaloacetate decarboxylase beta subunit n=1 Tax=Alkaliphilus hydrothermalis TaxID=1482730 RepID=A0ABS2NMD1_9FIRM|nr:sodium ion-translocating decarboxylase subunit beta [Alkaliphilus hydrothermalis]MBM7614074.1 Na+-transporting methylmalonyl-CoA/oxaloacetate decarboxylase beta subunit [Alkaliphilus hydrothermalis]
MKKNIFPWGLKKHIGLSLILTFTFDILSRLVNFTTASSVGIIGGADGPTVIFIGSKDLGLHLYRLVSILALVILLLLYKPTKSLINKYFK